MKKIVNLTLALVLCAVLAIPAAANTFVPSVGYKDGPGVDEAVLHPIEITVGGEEVTDCVVVTSIAAAIEQSTDIYQQARDLLIEVYGKLDADTLTLPVDGEKYVIRELVDISFKKTPCIEAEHTHEDELKEQGIVLTVVFDLGVDADEKVVVLSYHDGRWDEALSTVNNGDGTVTCVLEHLCPVAFCVEAESSQPPAQTGDTVARDLVLWVGLMAVSCAGIVVLAVFRRKSEQ